MTEEEKLSIAQMFGERHGYDIVTPAGVRNGFSYFDITNLSLIGRKTGLPHILKINENGRIYQTRSIPEIMWAIKQIPKDEYNLLIEQKKKEREKEREAE